MTDLEKAELWMKRNELDYEIYDGKVYVSVWNAPLSEAFDIQVAKEELRAMAKQIDFFINNHSKLQEEE